MARSCARILLDRLRELLAATDSGEVPSGPAYRHRVEGGGAAQPRSTPRGTGPRRAALWSAMAVRAVAQRELGAHT